VRIPKYFTNLLSNSRFYVLTASLLVSIIVAAWLRITIPSDQLFYIRSQQVYGLLAVILLYGAVILTPIAKLMQQNKYIQRALFARRAIGVSAFYFSLLHTVIAVADQLGGIGAINLLPERFVSALILGAIGLFILATMAFTSFDTVVTRMTFKRWKRLHSFVYLAGILIIVHVWLIGTHSVIPGVRIASAAALAMLFALESFRMVTKWAPRYGLGIMKQRLLGILIFALLFGSLWLLPLLAGSYHDDHDSAESTGQNDG
jgi:methionine sulfoxide reductase heme-binding subunit